LGKNELSSLRRQVMKNKSRLVTCFIIAIIIFLLTSCATTKLTTVWKDESFHKTIRKIVVVGAFRQPSIRNFFEDEFVRQLNSGGIDALASYTLVPINDLDKKAVLMTEIRRTGADAVLVTRMIDKKTVESYVPGEVYVVPNYYYGWGPYFDYIYQPGYMVREEYAFAETNIYETKNEKLIWAARSQTLLSGNNQDLIKSFVSTMTDKIASDKLIK